MDAQLEFEALRRESSSWWYVTRRNLLREAVAQAVADKREARVLDLGCTAQLPVSDSPCIRTLNAHDSLPVLAFRRMENCPVLVCTRPEELGVVSNSFDVVVAGDFLQSVPDDRIVLRELRRVLKDGGQLCLTVPAYPSLWGEEDEARGHRRRYTATELRRKISNAGFEVSRVSYIVASGFLPAVISRVGKNFVAKPAGRRRNADLAPWANAAMIRLLDCERQLIRYINLPFGTRVVVWARKPALLAERVTVPAWERQWAGQPLPQGMG